jgi:hypothetical protein
VPPDKGGPLARRNVQTRIFKTRRERVPFQAQYDTTGIVPATQTARTATTAGNPRKVDLVGSVETLKNVMKGKCAARKTEVIMPSPINGSARADFVLWKKIIQIASEGISMNLLTF